MKKTAMAATIVCALTNGAAATEIIEGRATVIDGDTIEIHGQRIRYFGIDAPESSQRCEDENRQVYRCGADAAHYLDALLQGKVVFCRSESRDRYKRAIAKCFIQIEGEEYDTNAIMVSSGMAVAYRKYSTDYVADEDFARVGRSGIWRGKFQMPWDYRKARRAMK